MQGNIVDDFEDVSGWQAIASGQAQLHISQAQGQRAKAMRLDFDFRGGGGFVVARKAFDRLFNRVGRCRAEKVFRCQLALELFTWLYLLLRAYYMFQRVSSRVLSRACKRC